MKGERESRIEAKLGKELRALGCLYYKFVSPGVRGVPDRMIVCPDGEIIFAELKKEGGTASLHQKAQMGLLAAHGQRVALVTGTEGARQLAALIRERHCYAKAPGLLVKYLPPTGGS